MSTSELFTAINTRNIPWELRRNMLVKHSLPVSNGWPKTVLKIQEGIEDGSVTDEKLSALKDSYNQYLILGEKGVSLFPIPKGDSQKLENSFEKYQIPNNSFSGTYPLLLDRASLDSLNTYPILVDVKNFTHGTALVYCSKRVIQERILLTEDDLTEIARERLGTYEKIILSKKGFFQAFDIVFLRSDLGIVETRIDRSQALSPEDYISATKKLKNAFSVDCQRASCPVPIGAHINLFPLISYLYSHPEGNIVKYSFVTDEGVVRTERTKRQTKDLKKESYHIAGSKAATGIEPFHITRIWETPSLKNIGASRARITLPGRLSLASAPQQNLEEVIIELCAEVEDYEFVFERLNQGLSYGSNE